MIIDLSHSIRPKMPVYPGDSEVEFTKIHTLEKSGYAVSGICMNSHAGTHIDAPRHFLTKGIAVNSADILEASIGPATVIDAGASLESGKITIACLGNSVSSMKEDSRLLIHTGWNRRFGAEDYFSAHPSITLELAKFIADHKLKLLGIDTPSISVSESSEIHTILLSAGIVIVENLCNLERIKGQNVFFSAAPLKLDGLDGSPVRAYAIAHD